MQFELDHQKAIEIINYVQSNCNFDRIRCSLSEGEIALCENPDFSGFNGWTRVSFDFKPQDISAFREFCETNYSEHFSFMQACDTIYEFQALKATKGQALDRLREHLKSVENTPDKLTVYGVGDFENDLDLLKHCDVPTCPSNAMDIVRKVAFVHLCHCRDGAIADLISRIEKGEA